MYAGRRPTVFYTSTEVCTVFAIGSFCNYADFHLFSMRDGDKMIAWIPSLSGVVGADLVYFFFCFKSIQFLASR